MAKLSQIDKAIAALEAEREILDLAITKLRAQQSTKATTARYTAAMKKSRGRKHANGEGATTDSGDMNYPPA